MKYRKYTIHTTTAAEELVCAMLDELGITGIEIENNVPVRDADRQGGVFEELQPDLPADDGSSRVSFYAEEGADETELLAKIKEALDDMSAYTDMGSGRITEEVSDEADWRDTWKAYFSSFSIGSLLIKPTWEKPPEHLDGRILLEIDPGVSFGTGKHESTQLVIRQMQKYLHKGDRILDVGCGSGILSIAALKMGASQAVGTDIDEDCVRSACENLAVNRISEAQAQFFLGDLTRDAALREQVGEAAYDMALANLLADIIIPMAPALYRALKEDGVLAASGIINFKEDEVRKALEQAGFFVCESTAQGEWRCLTAKKCSRSF